MLEICFMFSGHNLDADMAAVIEHTERYAEENSCFFGTAPEDFRNSLFWLTHSIGAVGFFDYAELMQIMKKVKLRDLVLPMLNTRELSCNDEGEYWMGEYRISEGSPDGKENWYDDPMDPVDLAYEYSIRKFFETPRNLTNESVTKFFRQYGAGDKILSRNFKKCT